MYIKPDFLFTLIQYLIQHIVDYLTPKLHHYLKTLRDLRTDFVFSREEKRHKRT